jgi:hypothetical protein
VISVLLFDVGGVLVQLSGIAVMLQWLGGNVKCWPAYRNPIGAQCYRIATCCTGTV